MGAMDCVLSGGNLRTGKGRSHAMQPTSGATEEVSHDSSKQKSFGAQP